MTNSLLAISVAVILLSTTFAHASLGGSEGTGGGKGVICRNANGSVKSVQLLDLWEAEHLFNRKVLRTEDPVQDQIENAIQRLRATSLFGIDDTGMTKITFDVEQDLLRGDVSPFFNSSHPNIQVKHLSGVTLALSEDSFEDAWPSDCAVEQVILYKINEKIFYVNDDLFSQMPKTDQAALILHEVFYSLGQLNTMVNTAASSVHSRRAIGYVFSGNSFDAIPEPSTPHITCQAAYSHSRLDVLSLFYDTAKKTIFHAVIGGYDGENPIGYFPMPTQLYDTRTQDLKALLTDKQCENRKDDEIFPVLSLNGGGPVDFDRRSRLMGICQKGKFQPFFSQSANWNVKREDLKPIFCKWH